MHKLTRFCMLLIGVPFVLAGCGAPKDDTPKLEGEVKIENLPEGAPVPGEGKGANMQADQSKDGG